MTHKVGIIIPLLQMSKNTQVVKSFAQGTE